MALLRGEARERPSELPLYASPAFSLAKGCSIELRSALQSGRHMSSAPAVSIAICTPATL